MFPEEKEHPSSSPFGIYCKFFYWSGAAFIVHLNFFNQVSLKTLVQK